MFSLLSPKSSSSSSSVAVPRQSVSLDADPISSPCDLSLSVLQTRVRHFKSQIDDDWGCIVRQCGVDWTLSPPDPDQAKWKHTSWQDRRRWEREGDDRTIMDTWRRSNPPLFWSCLHSQNQSLNFHYSEMNERRTSRKRHRCLKHTQLDI